MISESIFKNRQLELNELGLTQLVFRILREVGHGHLFQAALKLGTYITENSNIEAQQTAYDYAKTFDGDSLAFKNIFTALRTLRL